MIQKIKFYICELFWGNHDFSNQGRCSICLRCGVIKRHVMVKK